MSLFKYEDHADNPPATWVVVRVPSGSRAMWSLRTKDGGQLGTFETKRRAEMEARDGFMATLYEQERRWYAGEAVAGWKPWAEVRAEQERIAARWPQATTGASK